MLLRAEKYVFTREMRLPLNSSCIVKAHSAGLFSLINNVITCAGLYESVHVDWSDCIYGPDTWGYLFRPTNVPCPPYDEVSMYPDFWLTAAHAGLLYQGRSNLHENWRQECNKLWKGLKVLPEHTTFVDDFVTQNFAGHKIISALVRSNSLAGEQLTSRVQTLDEYAAAIDAELTAGAKVYVASVDLESLNWLADRFSVIAHPGTVRSSSRTIDQHIVVPQTPLDAVFCLQEVMLLSRASVFVHPVSNMATAALYMNTVLKSVFLA